MCPHTWSRLSVPAAKRLKYSERRKGLRASSSAVSPSNHASGVMPSLPSPRATSVGSDYIRSGDSPWRSRDARRRASVSGRALERVGEADQRGLARSEEHTSELQSPDHLVCRLLLEKKKLANATRTRGLLATCRRR